MRPIQRYIEMHSTVAVERSVLRLLGFSSSLEIQPGYRHPVANLIVEKLERRQLKNGVATVIAALKKKYAKLSQDELAEKALAEPRELTGAEELPPDRAQAVLKPWIDSAFRHLDRMRYKKEEMRAMAAPGSPLKCVLLATGDIEEDARQAKNAARVGADVVALARSTAQSLLDYVPHGATSEGYGGTFATQENWHFLRETLDDISREIRRYVRMSGSTSGLCMPELSAIAALEGVDFVQNDAVYGTLFRDINMKRALVDQYFSRVVLGRTGTVINTGEDNFLSAGGAYDRHHVVLASHFINEDMAKNAGMRDEHIGFTHAFEIDVAEEDGFVHEVAMGQLTREVFPRAPLRWMPPRHARDGDPHFSQALDAMYNLAGSMTGQDVQVLGWNASEAPVPGIFERFQSLKNANYVFGAARSLSDEVQFSTNGKVMRRARSVLDMTQKLLTKVREAGLFEALEQGAFAPVSRARDGGRGFDGVFERSRRYYNPFLPVAGNR